MSKTLEERMISRVISICDRACKARKKVGATEREIGGGMVAGEIFDMMDELDPEVEIERTSKEEPLVVLGQGTSQTVILPSDLESK